MWRIRSAHSFCRRHLSNHLQRRQSTRLQSAVIVIDSGASRQLSQRRLNLTLDRRTFSSVPETKNQSNTRNPSQSSNSFEEALAALPEGSQIHLDFFGEPVTFFGVLPTENISNAVAALDGFVIGVASKGKAFTGGGEEEGLGVQAAHSAALSWSELLRHAAVWNKSPEKAAPMLTYVAVAHMFAQTGVGYVRYVDQLLKQVKSGVEGVPPIQLMTLAEMAASMKDHEHLNAREKAHLRALDYMLKQDHRRAMIVLLRHLQSCPGDSLALSIVMDLAHTVGDKDAALRAVGSVAAYWTERRGSLLRPGIPGYNTTASLISLGLAVGGRTAEAEQMATYAFDKEKKVCGGIATWALAHVYDSEGRTAEGISACSNYDGARHFEECGLLYFDSILAGYGVRFALDREERGRGRSSALRLYDNNYERILESSGFSQGQAWQKPMKKAPLGWRGKSKFEESNKPKSFIKSLFGGSDEKKPSSEDTEVGDGEIIVKNQSLPSLKKDNWVPSVEDVLTWMPPTPQLLSDATLLLLRLTLNGTISTKNYRWENIRNAWAVMLDIQKRSGNDQPTFQFYPLASVAASLMAAPERTGSVSGSAGRLAKGLHKMGELLNLGDIASLSDETEGDDEEEEEEENALSTFIFREIVADKDPDFWLPVQEESKKEDWQTVLNLLSSAIDGVYNPINDRDLDMDVAELGAGFESWEFDVRPFLEHAVVYAACKCGDHSSLSLARSICSRGVTLRPNSPEEWWRYSIVLGLLGDEVAAEHAHQASIAFGTGQGARGE